MTEKSIHDESGQPTTASQSVHASTPTPGHELIARLKATFSGGARSAARATSTDKTSTDLAVQRTHLASSRTMMAADRSLMAWVRTALSMISFGFTIYKLLQGFEASGTSLGHAGSPRTMGLFLTGMGTVSMVLGTIEYLYHLQDARRYEYFPLWRPSFVMALLMSATGLFLFIAIIAKAL